MNAANDALVIAVDAPDHDDVRALLAAHLAFARDVTPEGHVHVLPVEALLMPDVTFFSARRHGLLVGIGALKQLDDAHGEIKSMHTSEAARRTGVGAALLDQLVTTARERGYRRVSLETGSMQSFSPARRLYMRAGFTPCDPFGDYTTNPHSECMTLALDDTPPHP